MNLSDGYNKFDRTLPQAGISRVPCAAITFRPSITSYTLLKGKTPPLFLASTVKSGGVALSAALIGPFPFPSAPWQGAQLDRNSISPGSTLCAQPEMVNATVTVAVISHLNAFFPMLLSKL